MTTPRVESGCPRILIVDDDPEILQAAQVRLAAAGLRIQTAGRYGQALELARHGGFDLLVLDVRLPDGDGLRLLAELRQLPDARQVPVIVFSASPQQRQAALEQGATFFLNKPYHGHQLLAAVDAALRSVADRGKPRGAPSPDWSHADGGHPVPRQPLASGNYPSRSPRTPRQTRTAT